MNRKGFTLLEMVVAVAILATIAGVIAGVIRLASTSTERGEREVARMARLKAGIDIVERVIRSADPTAIPLGDRASPYFVGEPDRIRLLSLVPPSAAPGTGFRLVCFSQAGGAPPAGLAVADASPFRLEDADAWEGKDKARILLPAADGLSFAYSAGPSPDGTWEWRATWDVREAGRLPGAVRVEFTMPSEGGPLKSSLVIPVFAEAAS